MIPNFAELLGSTGEGLVAFGVLLFVVALVRLGRGGR